MLLVNSSYASAVRNRKNKAARLQQGMHIAGSDAHIMVNFPYYIHIRRRKTTYFFVGKGTESDCKPNI